MDQEAKMVRVYQMVDPTLVKTYEQQIRSIFEYVLRQRIKSPEATFHISQTSGWIYYEDKTALRSTKPQFPPPDTDRAAKKIADKFLTDLAIAFRDYKKFPFLEVFKGAEFVPSLSRAAEIQAVAKQGSGVEIDHWLVRYEVSLFGDEERTRYTVYGAQLEVRVGGNGIVVAYNSRWNVLQGKIIRTQLQAYNPEIHEDGHSHGHTEAALEEDSQGPSLIYTLNGDDVPQFYLAPFYKTEQGHHALQQSATKYSLTAGFYKEIYFDKTVLTAIVQGGSGDYSYHWSYYTLEDLFDNGIVDITVDTPSIEIPDTGYTWVYCHILDKVSKAYVFHKEQVIGMPIVKDQQQNNLVS